MKLDSFTRAYIECALWSSTDNANESGGEPLDYNYTADDIHPETLARMIEDCAAFQQDQDEALETVQSVCDESRAGHNFWLNRNGHGSGFWDEYNGNDGVLSNAFRELSDGSKVWGSFDLYIGDDGMIHGQ